MKKQIGLFTAILFAVSTLMMACKAEVHTHTFSSEWKTDENFHWKECECGEIKFDAEHTFGDWITTKEPTEEAEGSREKSCTVCEYKVTEEIAKLEHTHKFATDWTKDETNHWHASTCGHTTEVSGKAAHSFGDWTVTKAATEEAEGSKERSCTVCGYTATEVIEKLAHTHKFASEWTSDETNHWHASTCGHEVTEGKTAHTFGDWTTTKAATCTEEGTKTGTCKVCKKEVTEKIDVKGHTFGIWEITEESTETESGQMQSVCEVCGETVTKELQPAPEGFRFVEAGSFKMGSNDGKDANKPVHEVTITKPFYMGKYEVTQAEYEEFCSYGISSPSSFEGDGDNYPAYFVSWYDALVYCNKRSIAEGLTPCYSILNSTEPGEWGTVPTSSNSTWNAVECNWNANGYRLPTEAEWEYAARAGDNAVDSLTYSGTSDVNELEEYAWYYDNSNSTTHEVGTMLPNAYGLYDMSGNVWEWCWNWWTDSYDTEAEGGSDPTGTSAGAFRVSRGGGWYYDSDYCAVSCRDWNTPYYRNDFYGFRVVRRAN